MVAPGDSAEGMEVTEAATAVVTDMAHRMVVLVTVADTVSRDSKQRNTNTHPLLMHFCYSYG